MDVTEQTMDTSTDDGEMALVITEPAEPQPGDGEWPAVVVFIDAPGLRPATRDFMARLASNGYRVITPDLHHRHGRLRYFEPADIVADPSRRQIIRSWIESMTDDQIQHDASCALSAAGVDEGTPFAAIGFCLGARAVYRAMQRNPQRVMCGAGWHPSFLVDDSADSPHLTAAGLSRPLYLGIGDADKVQSIAMHQKFLDAVAPNPLVDVTIIPGADHGFTWPGYPTYHETAAEISWTKTLAMLAAASR
ncbi:MAG: hydrolase [Acidimicrobiales bacterium]|nr:hydrolase [Acidimicrobiales bacterium]